MSQVTWRKLPRLHRFVGKDVPWLVEAQAKARGSHPFIIWRPLDLPARTISYAEFFDETRAHAAGLSARGVKKGDYVVIHMDNCPEFLFAWYACSWLGAVAVTTNTRSAEEEVAYFIGHCGARVVLTQPKYAALIKRAAPDLDWIGCTRTDCDVAPAEPRASELVAFEDLRASPDGAPRRAAEPLLANSVQYTSGTTSRPKGVVWTHANALWLASSTALNARLTADDVHIFYFPLFHTNALGFSVLSTLWSGGTAVMLPKFSARRFWPIAVEHRCTWANMVLFTLRAVMEQPDPERHWFRFWACAGDLQAVRERWGIKTIGWYGMTETVGQCTVGELDWIGPERSMGVAMRDYELDLRDEDGAPTPFGQVGNLWVRAVPGLSMFAGYLNAPEATAAAFDEDGWFETGDQVVALESGHFLFSGRAKDMLRVGGENVAALEIEAVILRTPGVIETAVVGKPDPMLEEAPVAFVVAASPSPDLKQAIEAACAASLADFKRPKDIIFVDALPKGLLDKVLKKDLRARLNPQ